MARQRLRLSVCKGPDCRRGGADDLQRAAAAALSGDSTSGCELVRGGCYGLCELGPNVVLRTAQEGDADPLWPGHYRLLQLPGERHYWRMDAERMRRLVGEIRAGRAEPAPDLLCPPARRPEGS